MREILFRGKNKYNGKKWFYGWFCGKTLNHTMDDTEDCSHIIDFNTLYWHVVDPESVGQYTGLTDKNGTKIFEGDIFKMDDEIVSVIIFREGCFRLQSWGLCGAYTESGYDECGGGWGIIECEPIDWYYIHDMEVIGNIHDNPELLEG